MESNQFICEQCGGVFDKEVTDEEAMKESKEIFGDIPQNQLAIVCDDCFKKVMERVKISSN